MSTLLPSPTQHNHDRDDFFIFFSLLNISIKRRSFSFSFFFALGEKNARVFILGGRHEWESKQAHWRSQLGNGAGGNYIFALVQEGVFFFFLLLCLIGNYIYSLAFFSLSHLQHKEGK